VELMRAGLRAPDLVVDSMGAGRQSTAMLAMGIAGELPRPDVVIHADTGWERPKTIAYVDEVIRPRCKAAGIPFMVVSNGNLREDMLRSAREQTRLASPPLFMDKGPGKRVSKRVGKLRRQCTGDYKIVPIVRAIRGLLGLRKGQRAAGKFHVVERIGIAAEESKRATGKIEHQWIALQYPLVERGLTTADCIAALERLGWPVPIKSACVGCPFRSPASWARMEQDNPAAFADACAVDAELRADGNHLQGTTLPAYLHRSLVPLAELDLAGVDLAGAESFGGEC